MAPILLHTLLTGWMVLAQGDSTSDFLGQARGLIVFICVMGILWIVIFALSLQRGAERRRAERLGLEPPPGFWTWSFQWIRQQINGVSGSPTSTPTRSAPSRTAARPVADDPLAPDLDLLLGDLPEPDLADMFADLPESSAAVADPGPVSGRMAARTAPDDTALADAMASDFAFDDDVPAPMAAPPAKTAPAEDPDEAGFAPEPFDLSDMPSTEGQSDLVDLLRVFRDIAEGHLIIDIEGQRSTSPAAVVQAGHSRRLIAVVRDLVALVKTAQQQSAEAQAAAPPPTAIPETSGGAAPPPDAVELLHVFRDLTDGNLVIDMNGQRFTEVASLLAAGFGRRFSAVMRDLVQMAQAAQKLAAARPAPAAPTADQRDQPHQPPQRIAPTALPDDELPSMAPGAMFRQMAGIARGQKPDLPPAEEQPVLSVAEEINLVLQERLKRTGEFGGLTIKVEPSLRGGVRIQVGDKFYEGVGDIENEDVRTLLQEVVREWEDRK